jgi:hypothetical protein
MREDLRDSSRNGEKVEVEFEEHKKRKLECVDSENLPWKRSPCPTREVSDLWKENAPVLEVSGEVPGLLLSESSRNAGSWNPSSK